MNPAREALSAAVNRAIAEGAPIYVNVSDDDDDDAVYTYEQLSDSAKEKARDHHRDHHLDYDWWDATYEDVVTIANLMSIDIDTRPVKLYGGGTRQEPCIGFSGFCSQGDGAHFEGRWTPANGPLEMLNAVMDYAPQDDRLHAIAFDLAHLSERCNNLIPDACVRVTHSGHYQHENCTRFEIELPVPDRVDEYNELQMMTWEALRKRHGLDDYDFEAEIKEALRAFMRWIYRQLEAEHDYLTSDEAIEESIIANGYTYDEDGTQL